MNNIIGADKFTVFEDVKNETTSQHFKGNQFSIDAFESKYALIDKSNETYVEAVKRVCDYIASVEKTKELKEYWSKRWFHEIYHGWWHPAGSIMQGAGSGRNVSLSNCTTVSLGGGTENEEWDSLEAIFKNCAYTVAKSAAYRQGIGVDFSKIRPSGTTVFNSAKKSTGSVHWMKFIDNITEYVGQCGRRPALLFSLNCKHPDIEEFIKVKSDTTKVQSANLSVHCTDDFYEAVKADEDWELSFEVPEVKKGQKIYVDVHSTTMDYKKDDKGYYYIAIRDRKGEVIKKTVKAKKLMMLIAKHMHDFAEPGIQNIDTARKMSNSDYVHDPDAPISANIISTNACSEQYLSRESLCVLSSLDCGRFSTDFEQLEKELAIIAPSINRFLDNVNECELAYSTCATPHQRLAIEYLRRTGAGVTNIAGWLFNKNVSYGSDKSAEVMEKFMERYAYHLYKSSIKLGEERGSFKLFNREKLEKAPFIKRMKKLGLEFTALRNVTLITIPPSGTVSLMFPESVLGYGVEPAFGIYFWKRTRMKTGNEYLYYFNVPSAVRNAFKKAGLEIPMNSDTIQDDWQGSKGKPIVDFIEKNKSKVGIEFKSSTEIKYIDKLELMAKINKWVDSSISTTYMLPENSTVEDVYDFIMLSHEKEVKSISAFPDRKMYGIVSTISFKELAVKLQNERVAIHPQNFNDAELKELSLSRENVIVHNNAAPKRELSLKADVYSVTVNKEKYIVAVGIQNGYPYEIFGGKMDSLKIKIDSKHLEGKITRVSRGKYSLEIGDVLVDDFSQQFTPIEKNLFRSLSLMLRYGIPIETIVEQYSKANDDIFSLPAAIARVLKKYIREGSKAGGKTCVKCGSTDLIYADGCVSCSICGTSFCS